MADRVEWIEHGGKMGGGGGVVGVLNEQNMLRYVHSAARVLSIWMELVTALQESTITYSEGVTAPVPAWRGVTVPA